jgi:hypothetical protein
MSAATTKAKKAKGDTAPKQDVHVIHQLGQKAQDLAIRHQVPIGARLPPVFLASFAADLPGLIAALPAVIVAKGGQVQLTAAQNVALLNGYNLVKGFRTTVRGQQPDKEVLLAYGIGDKTNKGSVPEVTAAIQKVLDRMADQPAEAEAFDFVDDDVKALNEALLAIQQAEATQEKARATSPQTTAQRNITARRILAGVKKIAGAGMRTFVGDATVYANFEALLTKAAG